MLCDNRQVWRMSRQLFKANSQLFINRAGRSQTNCTRMLFGHSNFSHDPPHIVVDCDVSQTQLPTFGLLLKCHQTHYTQVFVYRVSKNIFVFLQLGRAYRCHECFTLSEAVTLASLKLLPCLRPLPTPLSFLTVMSVIFRCRISAMPEA